MKEPSTVPDLQVQLLAFSPRGTANELLAIEDSAHWKYRLTNPLLTILC